jgi:hypothetical protein
MLFMARSVRETEAKKSLRRHIQKKHFIAWHPWCGCLQTVGRSSQRKPGSILTLLFVCRAGVASKGKIKMDPSVRWDHDRSFGSVA